MKNPRKNYCKGFTLVELLVSLGLFAVVMVICLGAVLTVLNANARSESASSIMTNLQVALDAMTREMRTGSDYQMCDGTNGVEFVTQDGITTEYYYESLGGGTGTLMKVDSTSGNPLPAVSDDVNITSMAINVTGTDPAPDDGLQPRALITISGTAGVKVGLQTPFNIQTTVSQRLLDSTPPSQSLPSCLQ